MVRVSAVQDAIQAVEGVIDVKINSVKARSDATPFPQATLVNVKYTTFAGYIVEETTAGETFTDTLSFILES